MSYDDDVSIEECLDKYGAEFSMFAAACKLGNLNIIKMIDKSKIDINTEDGIILGLLCADGNLEILEYIIQNFNIDMSKYINKLIETACINQKLNIFEYLMKFNPIIKLYDNYSVTLINNSCSRSEFEYGLLYYVNSENTNILKYLIDKNNVVIDNDIFIYCCSRGYYNIVKYLVANFKNEIDVKKYQYDFNIDEYKTYNYHGFTISKYVSTLKYLVDNCTDDINKNLLLTKLIILSNNKCGSRYEVKDKNKLIELIIYIIDKFNIDLNKHIDELLQNYELDLLKYIVDKHNMDILTNYDYFLSACKNKKHKIIEYIIETTNNVDITKNDYEAFKATFDRNNTHITDYLLKKYDDENMKNLYKTYNTNTQYSYTGPRGYYYKD